MGQQISGWICLTAIQPVSNAVASVLQTLFRRLYPLLDPPQKEKKENSPTLKALWKECQMMQVKAKAMKLSSITLLIPTASKNLRTVHDDITLIFN